MGETIIRGATVALLAILGVLIVAPPGDEPELTHVYVDASVTSVRAAVDAVRESARAHGLDDSRPLSIRIVDRVPGHEDEMVGGWQVDDIAYVRVSVGSPMRTLLHESAHAFTSYEHDEAWRAVYLDAVEQVMGADWREREEGRIRWVYDKCYLDDSC